MASRSGLLVVVDPTAGPHPSIERAAWLARKSRPTSSYSSATTPQRLPKRARGCGGAPKPRRVARATPASPRAARRAAARRRPRSRASTRAGITRSTTASSARRIDSRSRPGDQGHALPFGAQALDLLEHRLELIRRCAAHSVAGEAAAIAGQRPCFVAAVDPLHERDKPAELDNQILGTARELGEALGGEAHVFHAFDVAAVIAVSTDAMSMPIALPVQRARRRHARGAHRAPRAALQGARRPAGTYAHAPGRNAAGLVALTEQLRADAVVMGAVSRRGFKGMFLGNTAEDVLDRLDCDLIIVKPEGFKAVLSG